MCTRQYTLLCVDTQECVRKSISPRQRGTILVEILIAMAMFAVGIITFGQVRDHLAHTNLEVRVQSLASNIAAQEVELQKHFTQLASDGEGGAFAYQDVTDGTRSISFNNIVFTIEQDVTDFYWDAARGRFTEYAPPGAAYSDYKVVDVEVTWSTLDLDRQRGDSAADPGNGSVAMSTVISSSIVLTNHLAQLDESATRSPCVPLVSCPAATE